MKALQVPKMIVISLMLAILLAACGGTTNQGTTMKATATNTNTMNNQNDGKMTYGTPMPNGTSGVTATPTNTANTPAGIAIAPNTAGNMGAFIHTGKATVNGQPVDLLLTNKNFALYYYKPDTAFKSTCTGQCAQDWPPVLATQGMMTVSSSVPLPKQLAVRQTPNGAQVFYDGHALYTYAADTQPANATGRGEDMQWYFVGFQL
jgi:predicted lipoprotein with Yx(FWY)xxD motif